MKYINIMLFSSADCIFVKRNSIKDQCGPNLYTCQKVVLDFSQFTFKYAHVDILEKETCLCEVYIYSLFNMLTNTGEKS